MDSTPFYYQLNRLLWVNSSLPTVYHLGGSFRMLSSRSAVNFLEADSERLLLPIAAVRSIENNSF